MHRGYIKMWRKTVDSRVFQNEGLLKVWLWCLLRANHKKAWISLKTGRGQVEVFLKPGQFVFGRDSGSKELLMKPSTVWVRIRKLKSIGKINIESNSQYSIITILNWDSYQASDKKYDIESNNQVTAKQQPNDTDKNGKNVKNKIPFAEIIAHLNTQTGKNFRATSKKTRSLIAARFNDGHTFDDFVKVIDHKTAKWFNDHKMQDYLRPETLFGPKFEAYLNENGGRPRNSQKPDNSTQDACWQDFPK